MTPRELYILLYFQVEDRPYPHLNSHTNEILGLQSEGYIEPYEKGFITTRKGTDLIKKLGEIAPRTHQGNATVEHHRILSEVRRGPRV